MKIIKSKEKRPNGSYRYQSVPHGVSKTDASDKNMCCINNIMEKYQKTGLVPNFKEKIPQYIDVSQLPSYMDAHEQISAAKEMFMKLPAAVRRLMDNNPANLEKFVANPDNEEILIKYELIKKPSPKPENQPKADKSASVDKKVENKEEKSE